MANWPPSSPRMDSAMSAITWPVSLKSTCETNRLSPVASGMLESQVTIRVPASEAAFAAAAIWSPALLESITTS